MVQCSSSVFSKAPVLTAILSLQLLDGEGALPIVEYIGRLHPEG